jgi:hypothetical protein
MDHAVKASRSHPWNKLRFENDELEELYQRYTHKLQWISVFGVVTLVVMLTGIMAILSLAYNQAATVHVSLYIHHMCLYYINIFFGGEIIIIVKFIIIFCLLIFNRFSTNPHRMSSMDAFVFCSPSS